MTFNRLMISSVLDIICLVVRPYFERILLQVSLDQYDSYLLLLIDRFSSYNAFSISLQVLIGSFSLDIFFQTIGLICYIIFDFLVLNRSFRSSGLDFFELLNMQYKSEHHTTFLYIKLLYWSNAGIYLQFYSP